MNPLRTAWTSLKLLCLMAYVVPLAHPVQAQTVNTQVTLSCNDGHSVIFDVDQITLTSLLADIQAINASGTGTRLHFNHGRNRPLKRDHGVDGLRLQPFNSSDRAAELTQLNARDHNGHHN